MYKIYLKQAWALIRQERLFSSVYIVGTGLAISLVMVLFAAIRERLVVADVPAPFRGNAIALITAGLMSLAFMGFSGLVKL